jgi:ACR3 family arsenite transporter
MVACVQLIGNVTTVTVVLPTGEELVCDPVCEPVNPSDRVTKEKSTPIYNRLSLLDRFLFVWILVVMVVAIVVGYNVKGVKQHLEVAQIASVSLPIAIGLWAMMYPVLCKVKYEILGSMLMSGQLTQTLIVSLVLNWLVGPALMTALAWAALPDLPGYRSGVILVGIARCIAMVLIWNDLANGDPELCAVLVALNSVLQIALYLPLALFYVKVLGGQGIHVGVWEVAKSVLLFLGVPLAAGILTRYTIFLIKGKAWFEKRFVPFISPWALIGLLYTIFVMFSIQAHQILSNIGDVFRVAVPLLAYFAIVFFSTATICRALKMGYPETVTQSFTASSNNFELAIAVAVGSFGIDSQQALAATIGPLIEVPVLLGLVYVTLYFKKWFFKA